MPEYSSLSIVRARNSGNDGEHDEYRRQDRDRYADNARNKTGDCLGAAGVASRLRVDLVLDPAAEDDSANPHESANDATQAQDCAEDAKDES